MSQAAAPGIPELVFDQAAEAIELVLHFLTAGRVVTSTLKQGKKLVDAPARTVGLLGTLFFNAWTCFRRKQTASHKDSFMMSVPVTTSRSISDS